MPTTTAQTETARPVVFSRPIYWCDLCPLGCPGIVGIAGHVYTLTCLGAGPENGYRLVSVYSRAAYDVDLLGKTCECPDHLYRSRECKHLSNLRMLTEDGII